MKKYSSAEPVSLRELDIVPGVLGRIARERSAAYRQGAPLSKSNTEPLEWRGFGEALKAPGLSVIAEVKRASPSGGLIADIDPLQTAQSYFAGGASALSVLTEPKYFGGSLEHVRTISSQVPLPILRKDFTVHPSQLTEAVEAGATAALLIVAILGDRTKSYVAAGSALGLDLLVEVHDRKELQIAIESGAEIIGVNNRDLSNLQINLETAPMLLTEARNLGYTGLLVAESGYRTRIDLEPISDLADAVLIGSSLAASKDPKVAVEALVDH
ncbi:MAG: indole-3-glycerol phosphate synthase TrpC [Deinococcales bacterium]|nr:indole-3-glycerol phosphate synthase TrpC [Deinococcales bacterium]